MNKKNWQHCKKNMITTAATGAVLKQQFVYKVKKEASLLQCCNTKPKTTQKIV